MALCAALLIGCSGPSDMTGDLLPPATGKLTVAIAGLPGDASAAVQVTGPNGFARSVTASTTLTGLVPGTYSVTSSSVASSGNSYQPSPSNATALVTSSSQPEYVSVAYTLSTGSLQVLVSGLPEGLGGAVTVSGPQGFSANLTASTLLTGLIPGDYNVAATGVSVAQAVYLPTPSAQSVTVAASLTPEVKSVSYALGTGSLTVTVVGLPAAASASVVVSGPAGFSQPVTGSQTLIGLAPGEYVVSGQSIVSSGTTYNASPAQSVIVSAGSTASASITYTAAAGGGSLNLRIDGVYLTQATQAYDGSVPLVAGRNAYLRAFTVANQANTVQPQVRVRLYSGATLVQTQLIPAPTASVPTSVNEATLSSSWNVLVPAALVQPGLRILADVDPSNGIAEADESDNQFPAVGSSAAVDVRPLPEFSIRFVPVLQQVNGLQGNVTEANKEAFLTSTKSMLPVGAYSVDVRAIYTTTAPVLESGNGNDAWGTILNEVLALRGADASPRYYYGVVKTGYGGGVAGIGYVGGNARTSIGWDVMSSAPSTVAHELGHNMGRLHAPCGGPGGPDPFYPYSGGLIGVSGLDVSTLAIKSAFIADLMGYCHPSWISDYSWKGMLTYRERGPNNAPQASSADSGLLVWGRVTSRGIVLEPAFRVAARADLLPVEGPNRLELMASDGRVLRSTRFDATEVADLPGGEERHFAFVLPLDAPTERSLAGLRVLSGQRSASRVPAPNPSPDPESELSRVNGEQVQVRWNAARYPMVMVKDATSGQVLSFARGGSARLWARSSDFQLTFSDGVNSVTRPARILR